ncbi:Stk1 family PASTA domain-containing Ser/Thr kinase [Alicyclobacillus acidiphilus]|uniref:Stk1 family PASTA domain-containing Ser/Thr kinase n=1 Tax=Alicyclobacillus acidiphilus TaxID=182455 RepID=UPI00082EBF14|nr:Stk1 family PASTA domain-containing Ser/Thr kinase [Alicyclobacillus acidiphilus]
MTSRILGGRYQLEDVIGGGGMAVVYRAVDTLLDRVVAVKMLRTQFLEDDEFVGRFRQEAQSAGRLSHPNIVNVYDVGVTNNEHYIVMEYVDGPTLKDVIVERAPLSVEETIEICKQICSALQHAHELNVIHRDIKPHNILLSKHGQVKVADFGIARAVTGNTIADKQATSVLGSVHYFSPEQARGVQTDAKSDIYSLGVVMYEMLTGELPFSGNSPVSVALKHLREPFVEPRQLNKAIPQSVENIILKCLVKSPDGRYENMAALKKDLESALSNPNVPKFVPRDEMDDRTIEIPAMAEGLANVVQPKKEVPRWKRISLITGIVIVAIAALGVGGYAAITLVTGLMSVPNVDLPSVVGKPETNAVTSLENAGFARNQIEIKRAPNLQRAKGIVYQQQPPGNSQVKKTREITLYVSQGAPEVKVPDVTNQPYDQAKQSLVSVGFSANNISEQTEQSATVPSGQVISSDPAAGTKVPVNSKIVLSVSVQEYVKVPKLVGLTLSQAEEALKSAGLVVGSITPSNLVSQDPLVSYVYPLEGESVPEGSTVDIDVVSNPAAPSNETQNNTANSTTGSTNDINSTGNNAANTTGNSTTGESNGVGSGSTNGTSGNSLQNTTSVTNGGNVVGTTAQGAPTGGTGKPVSGHPGPPSHGTGTTTNPPPNAQPQLIQVKVNPQGRPTDVEIVISDARGSNQTVVDQTVNQETIWEETLYLTPGEKGDLKVYENGKLVQDDPVQG